MREWIKVFIIILIIAGAYAISWAITVGIIKLITLYFSWKFSLSVATGIWLILCLLESVFCKSKGGSK